MTGADIALDAGHRAPDVAGWRAVLRRGLDGVSTTRGALIVFLITLAVFVPTADRGNGHRNTDTQAVALSAGVLAAEGTVYLDRFEGTTWLVPRGERVVSNRWPGTSFLAAPFYLMSTDEVRAAQDAKSFPYMPAGVAAACLTALAMSVLYVSLRRVTSGTAAFGGVLVAAFATPTWSVSADALWTHGPVQLWFAVGMLFHGLQRPLAGGLAFAAAIFTRPPSVVAAALMGGSWWRSERRWRLWLLFGAAAGVGVAGLVAYHQWAFGSWSLTGGYERENFHPAMFRTEQVYALNVFLAFVDPGRGLLLVTPFLAALLPGLRAAWRVAPAWVRAAALAGSAELLFELYFVPFTGARGFWSYRLPLGALTLGAPLLMLAYTEWCAKTWRRRMVFWSLVSLAVAFHAAGAIGNLRY